MHWLRHHARAASLAAALLLVACSDDPQGGDPDGSGADVAVTDTGAETSGGDAGPGADTVAPPGAVCPATMATLTFAVDDTANQTYGPGELIWTGSFAYDEGTNTLTYATSWLPDEGPYPVLWDDGPVSAGGHEPEGATAGDHVWSVAVCLLVDADRLIDYGVLNDDLRWIWVGPNGRLDLPAGTTGVVEAPGMTIAAHGDVDFRVFLDRAALHADYATIDDTYDVYLKGTMNSWTPVQLVDAGILGDEAAGDAVFTYQQSLLLGEHDGLLAAGQEAQFVYVFVKGDGDPDDGLEYKVDGDAVADGVTAQVLCDGAWQDVTVDVSLDSKGKSYNTALTIPAGCQGTTPECSDTAPCDSGFECVVGTCQPIAASCDPACEAGFECVAGSCQPVACDPPCGSGFECVAGTCQAVTCDPACEAGFECVAGACEPVAAVCDPACEAGFACVDGACVELGLAPELYLVSPASGPSTGGTTVSLSGANFATDAAVTFGGDAGTVTELTAGAIKVTTPPHAVGSVDVVVTNPDGQKATFPGGFTYTEAAATPTIASVAPTGGDTGGGTVVTITGTNFDAAATVLFDTATATDVSVSSGTSITCTTPAHPAGKVTVTVINPDTQKATLPEGFEYLAPLADWGKLDGPATLQTIDGKATAPLSAQVYEPAVTDSPGAGFSLTVEVGYGPVGSDPTTSGDWVWAAASYREDVGNNDVWEGAVSPPEGSWIATLRFSINGGSSWLLVDLDGSDNGFDPTNLATVTVEAAGAVLLIGTTPQVFPPFGAETVTLAGAGFAVGCGLTLDGASLDFNLVDAETITFSAPPHPAGTVELALSCTDGSDTLSVSYAGSWDGLLDEWPATAQLATHASGGAWGADNHLDALYAATDGEVLYVAIAGRAEGVDFGPNAIVAYIDVDLGAGTGLTDTTALESDGAVDDALGGLLTFSASGFGAEVAFGTLNGATYTPDVADPSSVAAGWRGLDPTDNLPWILDGGVVASATGVEAWIPLATLLGAATGAQHALGINVRIANQAGDALPDDALPSGVSGASNEVSTEAASLTVTW